MPSVSKITKIDTDFEFDLMSCEFEDGFMVDVYFPKDTTADEDYIKTLAQQRRELREFSFSSKENNERGFKDGKG